ncbi:hypothetical protein [Streptomyces leeuwenhoekii]|uniref:Erythropoiesis-Stimulating Protein n=1 Tax=Streptomyces leeuwenhoekii TaxID=1437453 RepID=A0A0F7VLF6_STRLW|nr:hypothetical protein [Streptomyces leeuwenhoekii]CQR60369.1 Erythropoiesis-Stimulating Protein [Streptomyces leeuwenhoekii]
MTEAGVREALDRLVDMDLLTPSRDWAQGLRAVSPDVGLENMLRRQEAELALRQEKLARSKAAVARAVAEYADLRPNTETERTERLVGLDAIQARLEILTRGLAEECLSIIPGGVQSQRSLDASRPLDEEAMARGVHLRAVYQDSARNDGPTLAYAQWTTNRGGLVRTSPLLPPRMLIFDRRTALVPIDPEKHQTGCPVHLVPRGSSPRSCRSSNRRGSRRCRSAPTTAGRATTASAPATANSFACWPRG